MEELCETRGSKMTTENGCRLLDRDDHPSYSVLSRGRIVRRIYICSRRRRLSYLPLTAYSTRCHNGLTPNNSKALPRDMSTLSTTPVDLFVSWCEHTPKTNRPIKLNINAMLHEHRAFKGALI
ncbi:hypothetical protein ACS0PU_002235 [Formica fusca]